MRCVCASIQPGVTVADDRSTTRAPAGAAAAGHGPTLWMRLPRTTIAWSRLTAEDVPSMSAPARITTVSGGGGAGAAHTRATRSSRSMRCSSDRLLGWLAGIHESADGPNALQRPRAVPAEVVAVHEHAPHGAAERARDRRAVALLRERIRLAREHVHVGPPRQGLRRRDGRVPRGLFAEHVDAARQADQVGD